MTQMYQNVRKTEENRTTIQPQNNRSKVNPLQFVDNRPEAKQQRELQREVDESIQKKSQKDNSIIQMVRTFYKKYDCWSYVNHEKVKEVFNNAIDENRYVIIKTDDKTIRRIPKIAEKKTLQLWDMTNTIDIDKIKEISVGSNIGKRERYFCRGIQDDIKYIMEVTDYMGIGYLAIKYTNDNTQFIYSWSVNNNNIISYDNKDYETFPIENIESIKIDYTNKNIKLAIKDNKRERNRLQGNLPAVNISHIQNLNKKSIFSEKNAPEKNDSGLVNYDINLANNQTNDKMRISNAQEECKEAPDISINQTHNNISQHHLIHDPQNYEFALNLNRITFGEGELEQNPDISNKMSEESEQNLEIPNERREKTNRIPYDFEENISPNKFSDYLKGPFHEKISFTSN